MGWATTYLKKCKLLESTKRGCFKITERGIEVLNQNPSKIDCHFLEQFPEFHEFKTKKPKPAKKAKRSFDTDKSQTPEPVAQPKPSISKVEKQKPEPTVEKSIQKEIRLSPAVYGITKGNMNATQKSIVAEIVERDISRHYRGPLKFQITRNAS